MFPITLKESNLQSDHGKQSQFNDVAMLRYLTIFSLQKHTESGMKEVSTHKSSKNVNPSNTLFVISVSMLFPRLLQEMISNSIKPEEKGVDIEIKSEGCQGIISRFVTKEN